MEILIIIAGFMLFLFSLLGVDEGGPKGPGKYNTTPPFENEKEEK